MEEKGGGGGGGAVLSSVINLGHPSTLPDCQPIAGPEIINEGRGGFPLVTPISASALTDGFVSVCLRAYVCVCVQ